VKRRGEKVILCYLLSFVDFSIFEICIFNLSFSSGSAADHTCAVLNYNKLKCWGKNNKGQLGVGSSESKGLADHEVHLLVTYC